MWILFIIVSVAYNGTHTNKIEFGTEKSCEAAKEKIEKMVLDKNPKNQWVHAECLERLL